MPLVWLWTPDQGLFILHFLPHAFSRVSKIGPICAQNGYEGPAVIPNRQGAEANQAALRALRAEKGPCERLSFIASNHEFFDQA